MAQGSAHKYSQVRPRRPLDGSLAPGFVEFFDARNNGPDFET